MRESIKQSRLYRLAGVVLKNVAKMPVFLFLLGVVFGFYLCISGLQKIGLTGYKHSFYLAAEAAAHNAAHPHPELEYDTRVIISYDPAKRIGVKWNRRKDAPLSVSIITDVREE